MSSLLLVSVSNFLFLAGIFFCSIGKKNRVNAVFISSSLFIFVLLTTFFLATDYFTNEGVNDAVLYHLSYGLSGVGFSEYILMILGIVLLLLFGVVSSWGFIYFFAKRRGTGRKYLNRLSIILVLCAFALNPATRDWFEFYKSRAERDTIVTKVKAVNRLDFNKYYREPNVVKKSSVRKRNLVFIYAEGLERTYFDESIFPGLIKGLRQLESRSKTFTDIENTYGSSWTIGGMVASQCSIPLVTASGKNSMSGMNRFLSGAVCLGDLLQAQGYYLSFLGGASLDFAGKGNFYKSHSFEDVRGRKELLPLLEDKSYRTGWGLYDDSLLEIAYEQFLELSSADKPFGQFLLTLDTHHPKGHVSKKYEKFFYKDGRNSMLNAVAVSDHLLSQFVNRILNSPYSENTIIVIASDHLAMRNRASSLLAKGERKNLFMIIDPQDKNPQEIDKRGIAFDLGPTVLNYLGFEGEIGLGRDLLSDDVSLVEEIENFYQVLVSWRDEISEFWDIHEISALKIDVDTHSVEMEDQFIKFPVLITFDDQMKMNILFEFSSSKKLYDYLYELKKGTPFIWIDKARKIERLDPRLSLNAGYYSVVGGRIGAVPVISSRIDGSYQITHNQLEEVLSSVADEGTYQKQKRGLGEVNILPEIKVLVADIPRESIVFYSKPKQGESIDKYFKYSKYYYKKIKYENSIPDDKEFYFLSQDLHLVRENGNYTWERHPLGEKFRTVIKRHLDDTIIFSVRDEASNGLSEKTMNFLSNLGLDLTALDYRGSFAAVMDRGQVIAQKIDNSAPVHLSSPILKSKGIDYVESGGLFSGNYSSIMVDGIELSPNKRGINMLVLKKDGRRIIANFDTFVTEKMYSGIWKAIPK